MIYEMSSKVRDLIKHKKLLGFYFFQINDDISLPGELLRVSKHKYALPAGRFLDADHAGRFLNADQLYKHSEENIIFHHKYMNQFLEVK